jgi:hypothetical protein
VLDRESEQRDRRVPGVRQRFVVPIPADGLQQEQSGLALDLLVERTVLDDAVALKGLARPELVEHFESEPACVRLLDVLDGPLRYDREFGLLAGDVDVSARPEVVHPLHRRCEHPVACLLLRGAERVGFGTRRCRRRLGCHDGGGLTHAAWSPGRGDHRVRHDRWLLERCQVAVAGAEEHVGRELLHTDRDRCPRSGAGRSDGDETNSREQRRAPVHDGAPRLGSGISDR